MQFRPVGWIAFFVFLSGLMIAATLFLAASRDELPGVKKLDAAGRSGGGGWKAINGPVVTATPDL